MSEVKARSGRGIALPVIRYEPTSRHGEVLAPRGSVVVYLAAAGSEHVRAIHDRARGHRGKEGLLRDVDRVDQAGDLVAVKYGDTLLTDQVRVPRDGGAVRLILPFTGGEFEHSELRIVPHEENVAVEGVAIRHDPPLSQVERAALALLPRDLLGLALGAALPGGAVLNNDEERRRQQEQQEARAEQAAARAEAQAEAAAARAEARQAAREGQGSLLEVHLLDSTIKSMSPVQTAGAMLDIRRNLLIGK